MSNGYNYNPIPPRVWSRVQNPCTFIVPGSDYTQAFIPLTGQNVSQAEADYETKQIYKGNILQYKGNSARLTKSQKYSQLARCAGPNRTKVFATQSETYTNPNTTGLLRVGFQTYPFPNQIVGAPNNISGPFEYNIPNPNDCSGNSIQDGGTLVCGTYSNPCTGEIIKQGTYSATICNPASASNVPGSSILCWNTKVQTWFPRQRYFMNNSTDKWPINYKGFISAVYPESPILEATSDCSTIFLNWTESKSCFIITAYEIYIDNSLYITVSSNTHNYNLNLADGIYDIFIIAKSNNFYSKPSNSIIATIRAPITIIGFSNINKTVYNSAGFTTVVIQTTIQPSFNGGGVGTAAAYICGIANFNCLIIGGGGGGASGYYASNGGGGGGSGAINLITNLTIPSFTTVNISVGSGGGGRTPGNQGQGQSTGQSGNTSSISFGSTTFQSTGGGGGLGIGSTLGYGGGPGGNANNINGIGTFNGYGGSGGGGGYQYGGGSVTVPGSAGTGYTSNGNSGSNGSNTTQSCLFVNAVGGNGGDSVYSNITIPGLGTINIGGGGGGGGSGGGGGAGNASGGNGGVSCNVITASPGGQSATIYGAGGGGGSSSPTGGISDTNNTGGNGANGVIIIWYQ